MEEVRADFLQRLRELDFNSVIAAFQAHYADVTWVFLLDLTTDYGVFLVAALGLYVLMSAGQVSLGHAGLVGISAYGSGVLVVNLGLPFWLALPICGLVGMAAGVLYFFLLGFRLSGFYLAIGTFLFLVLYIFGPQLVSLFVDSNTKAFEMAVHGSKLFGFAFFINGINIRWNS